jgi:hypothetical protein
MLADADGAALLSSGHLADRFSAEEADAIIYVLGTNPRRLLRFGTMLALWLDVAQALTEEEGRVLRFSPLETAHRPLFLKLSLLGYLNSALLAEMRRNPGLPGRIQTVFNEVFEGGDELATTAAERAGTLKRDAATAISNALKSEVPVVAQALLDPAMIRALRLEPLLTRDPVNVAAALRWFRSAGGRAPAQGPEEGTAVPAHSVSPVPRVFTS